jgi:hypothetical protein
MQVGELEVETAAKLRRQAQGGERERKRILTRACRDGENDRAEVQTKGGKGMQRVHDSSVNVPTEVTAAAAAAAQKKCGTNVIAAPSRAAEAVARKWGGRSRRRAVEETQGGRRIERQITAKQTRITKADHSKRGGERRGSKQIKAKNRKGKKKGEREKNHVHASSPAVWSVALYVCLKYGCCSASMAEIRVF